MLQWYWSSKNTKIKEEWAQLKSDPKNLHPEQTEQKEITVSWVELNLLMHRSFRAQCWCSQKTHTQTSTGLQAHTQKCDISTQVFGLCWKFSILLPQQHYDLSLLTWANWFSSSKAHYFTGTLQTKHLQYVINVCESTGALKQTLINTTWNAQLVFFVRILH